MKAVILAAGLGTRLRPITDSTPKCLVDVCGKPLLEWWFSLLANHNITEFFINTHHLPEQVEQFVMEVAPNYDLKPTVVYEPELLGSAGTLMANREYFTGKDPFLVAYGDILTNTNLNDLIQFHKEKSADISLALFRMPNPETRGIVSVDEEGRVLSFTEKPKQPESDLANGGIYIVTNTVLDNAEASGKKLFDIGKDILQPNRSRMFGLEFNSYLRDIGSIESLAKAQIEWDTAGRGK